MYGNGETALQRMLKVPQGRSNRLNCSVPAILEFPDFMRTKSILSICFCILICVYLFIFLASVCDEYLVSGMERVCFHLRITYDVAGATFLAVATSAPECCINLVGSFMTKGDVGVGAILGSSVFNLLFIAGICGIFTGVSTQLHWWPITRDTLWYLISIAMITGVMYNSKISLFEPMIMLFIYSIYLMTLIFDHRIRGLLLEIEENGDHLTEDPMEREGNDRMKSFKDHVWKWPPVESEFLYKVYWYIKYPGDVLLAVTIPSVRTVYVATIIVSIIWISIVSYLLAWALTIIGFNIGVPDAIMDLTLLATCTSLPEIVSGYIVTRRGYGSMAMCNAIAANTFDLLVCLSIPWILKIIINNSSLPTAWMPLLFSSFMLVSSVLLLYCILLVNSFVLGKVAGYLCTIIYIIYLILSCTVEIHFLLPVCTMFSDNTDE